MTTVADLSAEAVWELTVDGLAEVLVVDPEEIRAEAAAAGGDVVIKSKDAEVVISFVEEELGGLELVDQSHLGRTELTSLRTLSALLWRRYRELHGREERE